MRTKSLTMFSLLTVVAVFLCSSLAYAAGATAQARVRASTGVCHEMVGGRGPGPTLHTIREHGRHRREVERSLPFASSKKWLQGGREGRQNRANA